MDVITVKVADDEGHDRRKSRISSSMGRSAALEQAYVHDVYEEICSEVVSPLRPRVTQFLTNLEPGSMVCDVGCGNGRYLTPSNSFIYSIGIDRCHRLSQSARSRGNEVALCDNLELPFRNESFDAVLSLAVVHHFATKDRRVEAIKEIARVLRIGGRAIITVWALEQRSRRFVESQDVLIPCQISSTDDLASDEEDEDEDFLPPYSAYSEDSTTTSTGDGDSSSLDSSSLSPVESCCIFMRRAIQKLASGKKHSWFLDSINAKDNKLTTGWDVEDAKNLPIELRRLEDFDDVAEQNTCRIRLPVVSPTDLPPPPLRLSTRILTKQASLNEDLMAESRQRDREGVRKKIQKQASLNESFLCRSLSKRLQLFSHGIGGALKSSTEGLATKAGFGSKAGLQSWLTIGSNRRHELTRTTSPGLMRTSSDDADIPSVFGTQFPQDIVEIPPARHESGSDSSKESSLQSDTSVESEDSFASVIYVPHADQKMNSSTSPTQSPALDAFALPEILSPASRVPPPRPPLSPAPSRKPTPMPFICEERRFCAEADEESQCLIDKVLLRGKMDARARMKAYFSSRTTSLDIYHPETDDLESDSTEPSSPDSVDSVVSALKIDEAICGRTRDVAGSVPEEKLVDKINVIEIEEKEDMIDETDEMSCRQFLVDYADRLSTKLLEDVNGKLATHSFVFQKAIAPNTALKSPPNTRLSPREFTLPLNTGLNGACGPQNSENVINRERMGAKNLRQHKGPKPKININNQKGNFSFDFRSETETKSRPEPDVASMGGSATHHRYYHVFREGELEALINHHVASLHIVSSYYERASWCVIAEKVQVWTI